MTFIAVLIGTIVAGIGSVWIAALLSFGMLTRYTTHLLSLAAGALLATAFMHLLPDAFESDANEQALFTTLLVGLIFSCLTRQNCGIMDTNTMALSSLTVGTCTQVARITTITTAATKAASRSLNVLMKSPKSLCANALAISLKC